MKIVDRKTFLAMPEDTLFSKYQRCCCDGLCIKGETIFHDDEASDFCYSDITMGIESHDSEDEVDKLIDSEVHGTSIPMNFDEISRDGCYDKDQLFAVWEDADVVQLILRIGGECG